MGVAYGLRCISLIYVLLYCDCHEMTYEITTTWDSLPVNHDPVTFKMSPGDGGLKLEVFAPFWDSPAAPDGPPGKPFPHLWNYEVVEAMFLSDDSTFLKDNYLEVELCPHGQQLVLFLHGESQSFKQQLPLSFNATITGNKWYGVALLPWAYFPPNINKVNLYAIHGEGAARVYESLSPVPQKDLAPGQKANFHLLQYFQDFCLQSIMGEGWVQPECSDLWAGKC